MAQNNTNNIRDSEDITIIKKLSEIVYSIMDSELGKNDENCTDIDLMKEVNNSGLITSSNILTDTVKKILENLVIE